MIRLKKLRISRSFCATLVVLLAKTFQILFDTHESVDKNTLSKMFSQMV